VSKIKEFYGSKKIAQEFKCQTTLCDFKLFNSRALLYEISNSKTEPLDCYKKAINWYQLGKLTTIINDHYGKKIENQRFLRAIIDFKFDSITWKFIVA